jgi:hypothetical protein
MSKKKTLAAIQANEDQWNERIRCCGRRVISAVMARATREKTGTVLFCPLGYYYSFFHITVAILYLDHKTHPKELRQLRHKALRRLVEQRLVQSRILPRAIMEMLQELQELREASNYAFGGKHEVDKINFPELMAEMYIRTDGLFEACITAIHDLGECVDQGLGGMAIWARANEKARRLALIYACSANHTDPCISVDAARWACEFVDHQTRRMLFMTAEYVAENEFDGRCKKLVATLRKWREKHGDAWMPFWQLNRKHPWSERDHEEVRTTLLNQRLIDYQEKRTGGTPQRLYRLA